MRLPLVVSDSLSVSTWRDTLAEDGHGGTGSRYIGVPNTQVLVADSSGILSTSSMCGGVVAMPTELHGKRCSVVMMMMMVVGKNDLSDGGRAID